MKNVNILVLGGGASGLQSAITAKTNYPDKSVVLVRKEKKALVPCGIPYIFGTLDSSDKNIMPDKLLTDSGVEITIDEAENIDIPKKICTFNSGEKVQFERLVFALGSIPVKPKGLKGVESKNVFTIPKNKVYLDEMHNKLRDLQKIIIVGAGFIGVEVADEMNKGGWDVTLIEIEPYILNKAFDKEFGNEAEELLMKRGVKVITNNGIQEIKSKNGKVSGIELKDNTSLEADAVVLTMGYVPNTSLLKDSGIQLNKFGFIKTCEYMRINDCQSDYFAVGDCAEKCDFITRKIDGTMLASTACAEARIAGMNLYELGSFKTFNGTIAIYDTAIGETAFGTAGVTEAKAKKGNFEVVVGSFTGMDKHPGTLPNMQKQMVKLIAGTNCGMIIGGEVMGGTSIGELTNAIGFLIQNRVNIYTLLGTQIGTHPLLTGSPAGYPLIKAAEVIAKKLKR